MELDNQIHVPSDSQKGTRDEFILPLGDLEALEIIWTEWWNEIFLILSESI